MKSWAFAFLVWTALGPSSARALTIEYEFSGEVVFVFGEPSVAVELGDSVTLVATFRDASNRCLEPHICAPPINGIGERGLFDGNARVEIRSTAFDGITVQGFVNNDYDDIGRRDRFDVAGDLFQQELKVARFGVALVTDPPLSLGEEGPIDSVDLPMNLDLSDWHWGPYFLWEDVGQTGGFDALVSRVEVRVVPEAPAPAALGVALLLYVAWRAGGPASLA